MSPRPARIAMWSGPRNISTAMMRSWGSRLDTFVTDEPLYAHYLSETGKDHPGRDQVLARYETDWRKVVDWLTGPVPEGKAVWFQKHMTHHLLPDMGREWIHGLSNCFLIRHPRDVITSYIKVVEEPTTSDLGFRQQVELFELAWKGTKRAPPVIDASDVLQDPQGMLVRLCEAVELPFDPAMLSWEAGPRPTDGIWAEHWYTNVERSTAFAPYRRKNEEVPIDLQAIYAECLECYETLSPHRLHPAPADAGG